MTRITIVVAIFLLSLASVHAAPGDVDSAYKLCRHLDATGLNSAPCSVSGWNSSVTISVDMSAREARDLCPKIADHARRNGMPFGSAWTLQIKSPYSGNNSIAFCSL